jgi:hypothetical protein
MWLPIVEVRLNLNVSLLLQKISKNVIDVLSVICLSSDSPIDSPTPNIDLVEGPQVLVEVLEQNINKTCDYESKKKFQVLG